MTWLCGVKLLGPRRVVFLGSGTQTLSSGYDPADSPKLPRQEPRDLVA